MRATIVATVVCVLGSVYASQPWDMAFSAGAVIGGGVMVLLLCIRYSTRAED
jgi:multisubunit Na+/H+ antiporter MnhB subunit